MSSAPSLRPPQPSTPWDAARIRTLLPSAGLAWRDRTVVEALLQVADIAGRVFFGNQRLADLAAAVGPQVARAMGLRRTCFRRFHVNHFAVVLARLRWLGIVDHWWPRVTASGRQYRILRVRVEGLQAFADFMAIAGRPWRYGKDPKPVGAPCARVNSWRARRLVRGHQQHRFDHAPTTWRSCAKLEARRSEE